MTDFLTKLIDILQYINPAKIVMQWERGLRYTLGKSGKELEPGIYFIIPFFQDIKIESIVPNPHSCPMQSITLLDGKNFNYNLLLTVRVENLTLAYNSINSFAESAIEIGMSITAAYLSDCESAYLIGADTEKRAKIYSEILELINFRLADIGLIADSVSLQNFSISRTIRLLMDKPLDK